MRAVDTVLQAKDEGKISADAASNLTHWLTDPAYAEFTPVIEGLLASPDWSQIEDAFYTHITIGTGGIRGPLGVGSNRINTRTIGEAAQGLAQFIHDFGPAAVAGGVVVGYEARRQSRVFAELCAEVFAGNGIPSYLFEHLCPTPEVSFAVRHCQATAGVMITASHNPRTDNGFKFYWSDGGQVVPPYDAKFMELVTKVIAITKLPLAQARAAGLVRSLDSSVDAAYVAAIRSLSLTKSRSARVVFSPLHGAGSMNVLPVLQAEGFDVTVVPEQAAPDENFPTAHGDLINPEFLEVMALPMRFGEAHGADIVLNSDPDADRVGVAVRCQLNAPAVQHLNGDEVGALLTYFLLSELQRQARLPKNGVVLTTYVTTSLIGDITRSFHLQAVDDLLVGFKYIAEHISKLADQRDFIFAAEQSLGYLAGTFVKDKDAAIASLFLAEMASCLKDSKKTFSQYLDEIYQQYGYYKNVLTSVELKGHEGKDQMAFIMQGLRQSPPRELGGRPVLGIIDRLPKNLRDSNIYTVGKTGDQLTFILSQDGRSRVTVRPSGTEPTIKHYIQHFAPVSPTNLAQVRDQIDKEVQRFCEDIKNVCASFVQR